MYHLVLLLKLNMPFYSHKDNITILWNSISNSSMFLNFNYPNDKYVWFNNIVDEFIQSNPQSLSTNNLNELNCITIKRMFDKITEYQRNDNQFNFSAHEQTRPDNSSKSDGFQKNSIESQFDQRMREYDSLMNVPAPSPISFNLPKDNIISDFDELVSRRLKDREMDFDSREMNLNSSTQKNTIQNSLTNKMLDVNNINQIKILSIDSSLENLPLTDIEYVTEPRIENDTKSKSISWKACDNSECYLQYIKELNVRFEESNAMSNIIIRNTEFIMSKLEKVERMLQIREIVHDESKNELSEFSLTLPIDVDAHNFI